MSLRAEILAQKKRLLLAESRALRTDLTQQLEPLSHTLDAMDSGLRIFARLRRHPEWVAGAAVGLLMLKPRRLSGWLRGGALGLRTWRQFSPMLRTFMAR